MVRRFRPIRAKVGKQSIPNTASQTEAEFTAAVNRQLGDLVDNFKAFVAHMQDVSADVLYDALEPTFRKSQRYAPVKTKALVNSGYLEKRQFRGESVVEIGYGKGGEPHYAPYVHERLDLQHKSPTKAKFLQAALEEDANSIQSRIVRGMKEASGV